MSGKTVLITGCSAGGIGHALVLAFQKRGLTVFATARSLKKMDDLVTLPNVHLIALDVTDPTSVLAAVREVDAKTGGKLDILVNNAGQNYLMPSLDADIDKAKALFEVNYWAPFRMIQAFAPALIAAKGSIVNIGSVAGVVPIPFQSHYNASKAALNLLSETLRLELAPLNVRVITLLAGNVVSNIGVNAAPPPNLPASSQYLAIEKYLTDKDDTEWPEMPTREFAETLVQKALGGVSGKIWVGGNTAMVKWFGGLMPQWLMDRILINTRKGLGEMAKA